MSYSIPSVIVNQDTSDDVELWKVKTNVVGACSSFTLFKQNIAQGHYTNIITTMEQLSTHEGHMGKFTWLICKDRKFISHVKRIAVDEAHTVYTTGVLKHNKPAY